MAIGLVGRKCGMTRVFTEAGESVPVTVIEALPSRVVQVKDKERDGRPLTAHEEQRRAAKKQSKLDKDLHKINAIIEQKKRGATGDGSDAKRVRGGADD